MVAAVWVVTFTHAKKPKAVNRPIGLPSEHCKVDATDSFKTLYCSFHNGVMYNEEIMTSSVLLLLLLLNIGCQLAFHDGRV